MTWTDPTTWYSNLAAFHAAAAAFMTDPAGNVLLVKPTYRDYWAFPGGYVDAGEHPHEACAREIREELGQTVVVGDLLVVDWAPPAGQRPRAIINFIFDCGTLASLDGIGFRKEEIEAGGFFSAEEAARRLPSKVTPRVYWATYAQRRQTTAFLIDGTAKSQPPTDVAGGWESRAKPLEP
ncbi:NUDIX hydrolase [Micromonospora sp. LAH09]|uniref:NUDIX domain-containing protein n=1 Tax=Micromonospora cabrerizensis TaxID=2911213 RepID=UPI001EE8C60D|nr:NUDIX hydrolase [Micromonospora cabrerizensis]MCG5469492.1 NUDIX hydrolase [Micromonospora cabrerizensis]